MLDWACTRMNVSDAIKVVRITDVGLVREQNEDAVASDLSIGLLILADGMGGYRAGEVASEIAVLTLTAEMTEAMRNFDANNIHYSDSMPESDMLIGAVERANSAIFQVSNEQSQCAGMGTTLVAAVFSNNKLAVGHIGDSRMYRLRAQTLTQLTEDHSLLQEQINAGLITREQAKLSTNKNLVTRALGIDEHVELEINEFSVEVHDCYLLCSDGLSDFIDDDIILKILLDANGNIELAANLLVQAANEQGGCDNISIVIAIVNKAFTSEKNWAKQLLGKVLSKTNYKSIIQ